MIREFVAGVRTLIQGFGYWRTHTGVMLLGLVPAAIAFLLLAAALLPLFLSLGALTAAITPFADGWDTPWQALFRGAVSLVIAVASLALAASVFSALALTIGDPFYQRIWRAVERDLGVVDPADGGTFWESIGEGIRLVLSGLLVSLLVLLLGFIPVVGGAIGAVSGVLLTGRLLARELTGRAFDARGLDRPSRNRLRGTGAARMLGFGASTQLCFLIPLGAVITMPAAVAGSTVLAHTLLGRDAASHARG